MITIVNKNTGQVLFATSIEVPLNENEIAVPELLTEKFVKPFFNFQIKTFYEGATQEEINNLIIEAPQEVQLWRLRTILNLRGLEPSIVAALNSLSEPTKTGALFIWEYGTTVERQSQTVLLLQNILQLTESEVDQIFIEANNIKL